MIKVMGTRSFILGLLLASGVHVPSAAAAGQTPAPAAPEPALDDVLKGKTLNPPLRGDVTRLRFSPDGNYVLAQDDSGIYVLRRQPFELLSRVDAPEANPAHFTPDSRDLVFTTPAFRVETWNIAAMALKEVHQVPVPKPCLQTALAPDGKVLACFDTGYGLGLYDVASALPIYREKDFYPPSIAGLIEVIRSQERAEQIADWQPDWVYMDFSPDGRYFVASQRAASPAGRPFQSGRDTALALDINSRTPVRVPESMRALLAGGFAFVAPDRLAARNREDPSLSAMMTFPEGKTVHRFFLAGRIEAATHPNFVLVRSETGNAIRMEDLETGLAVSGSKTGAIDAFSDLAVIEEQLGELILYHPNDGKTLARLALPRKPLAPLYAAAASPDLHWLAVSERTAGKIWDLSGLKNAVNTVPFHGAYIAGDGSMYADFPKSEKTDHVMIRGDFSTGKSSVVAQIQEDHASQAGPFMLITSSPLKIGPFVSDATLTVRDVRTYRSLWTRSFPAEVPLMWTTPETGLIVFGWPAAGPAPVSAAQDAALPKPLSAPRNDDGSCLLEVLNGWTGKSIGRLRIGLPEGLSRIAGVVAAAGSVLVADTQNRVHVYSSSTGKAKARQKNSWVSSGSGSLPSV